MYKRSRSRAEPIAGNYRSFVMKWIFWFAVILLATQTVQIGFMLNVPSDGSIPRLSWVMLIVTGSVTLGAIVMYKLFRRLRNEVTELSNAILAFAQQGRQLPNSELIASSHDEVGEIAYWFNQLQRESAEAYRELEEDLYLAASVREMILPAPHFKASGISIQVFHESSRQIDGDFYDFIPLDDGRIVAVLGKVMEQGLSAALIVSSVIVLLRTEVREGGSAMEMLERLDKAIEIGTKHRESRIIIGIMVIDPNNGLIDYAGAGVPPPIIPDESCRTGDSGEYLILDPGTRAVLYTEGFQGTEQKKIPKTTVLFVERTANAGRREALAPL